MSGSGEIIAPIAGVVAIIPLAAIAVAAGATILTGKALVSGIRLAAKEAERARENRLGESIGSFAGKIENINTDLNRKIADSAEIIQRKYEAEINALKEMASDEADVTGYIKQCAELEERMLAEIDQSRQTIEKEAADTIRIENKKISSSLSEKRALLESSINSLADDMASREEKSRVIAEQALEQAFETAKGINEMYGDTPTAKHLYDELRKALKKVKKQFEEKQYEAVIIASYAVTEQAVTGVADILEEERRSAHYYNRCTVALQEIRNYISNMSVIEYTFNDTNSGEPRLVNIGDFSLYFGEEWQKTVNTADRIGKILESADHNGFVYEELSDILRELNAAKTEFTDGMQIAYKRLHNALLREEWADIIAQGYVEMGYEEKEPAEYDPLEKTVMLFENSDGEDQVRVTLRSELMSSGNVEICIDVDEHAGDLSKVGLESERVARREEICDRLSDSSLCQRLGIMASQSCKNTTRNRNAF